MTSGIRCSDNFDAELFQHPGRRVRFEWANVPDGQVITNQVRIFSDWAALPDPARTGPVGHNQDFLLSVPARRKILGDWQLYFATAGWNPAELKRRHPDLVLKLTMLHP